MTDDHKEEKPAPVPVKSVVAGSWREMGARWLFDQGVPTVLLILILSAVVWRGPQIATSFKEGYQTNAAALQRTTELYIEARDREITRILDSHERDRATFERALLER